MGSVAGEIEPTPAEPVGYAALQPDPGGPREFGDPRAQARVVHQRLDLGHRDRGTELAGRRLTRARGPGGEQAPGCPLAEAEGEHQPPPSSGDTGGVAGEIAVQFGVGQHDLYRVRPSGPPDARLGAHGTGRAVAAGHEAEPRLLGRGRLPQDRPRAARAAAQPGQFGTPLDLYSAIGQRLGQHPFHFHLPYQRQVRESGVRQGQVGEGDLDQP